MPLPLLLRVSTLRRLRSFGRSRLAIEVGSTLDGLRGLGDEFAALPAVGAILGRTLAFGARDIEVDHDGNYMMLVHGALLEYIVDWY